LALVWPTSTGIQLASGMSDIANLERDLPRLMRHGDGLRLLLETALDAVVVMTSDGIVAEWNDRATNVFGWSRDEALGQTMADLIIPERYREAHKSGIRRYLETGRGEVLGRRVEVSGVKKNGDEFPLELSISPVLDDGRIVFVGCLRDISDRNALRLARADLARVRQKMAMGEMAASIAHEIKQPLAAIATNANAGLRWLRTLEPDLAEARVALKRVVDDCHRADEVINGIRTMFRKDIPVMVPQDINELVREVLSLVRGEVENQQVSVRTELLQELPPVLGNQVQLRQAIVNLIVNAIDAMSAVIGRPRMLQLKTEPQGFDSVLLSVEDSGTGIETTDINRIFDAFFTTKSHGMGMGLSICRSIIENHGGRLSVSPGRPHGAIFQVLLPTADAWQA
jgi:PAS domain S-box-containing protein